MTGLTIRKVLAEEVYEYSTCHIASWRSAYRGIVPDDFLDNLSVEERAEKLRRNLDTLKEYGYYCAVYDDRIIGTLIIGGCRDENVAGAGEVCAIYLLEEFWGKGPGKEMMDFAVEALRREGYDRVAVWALEENLRARRFYEKCGYVFDGTKKEIMIGKPLVEVRGVLLLS